MRIVGALVLIAACGSSNNGGNVDAPPPPVDSKIFMDAPPNVPATITVSGVATEDGQNSSTPLAGVAVELLKTSDDSSLGSATSAADGSYSITVQTNGLVVDAYLHGSASGYVDNFAYPTAPLQADATIGPSMVTTTNFSLLGGVAGQSPNLGFIAVEILDGSGNPVEGATISSNPASGKYNYNSGGIPTGTTATASDGQGYFVNVPAGAITISAAKSGIAFKSHVVKAHVGALTVSTIEP
jgi:hypothetical protein